MLGSKNGRVLVAGGLLSGILALGILACAGTPEPQEVSVDTGTIEDVVVDSSGDGSRLTFLGRSDRSSRPFSRPIRTG